MKALRSLIYLSKGNLPSKMAHTIQIAKMSQAFSQKLEDFELVTSGDIGSFLQGMDSEFQNWYGLNRPYKLIRLPMHLKVKYPFSSDYENNLFYKLAIFYACLKLKPSSLVYTRTPMLAEILLKVEIPTIWEFHAPVTDEIASVCHRIFTNKNLVCVVTISPYLATNYTRYGLKSNQILIAPNAADTESFSYQGKEAARQALSLSQVEKIVLYSGHLYESKGISTILKTAEMIPDYKFFLVGGWQNDIDRVKEVCQTHNLSNVNIVGHVPQAKLALYLCAADILILPTSQSWDLAEFTCPLKLYDYMLAKRPIVASALPTIMTVLQDRKNALLAEPDNPLAFKESILTLMKDPALAIAIAERAYQEVTELTWDRRASRILQFAVERLNEINEDKVSAKVKLFRYVQKKVVSTIYKYSQYFWLRKGSFSSETMV